MSILKYSFQHTVLFSGQESLRPLWVSRAQCLKAEISIFQRIFRFTITNLSKPTSLYNLGLRPLVYSEQKAKDKKIGWHRCGENIKYYRSQRNVFLNYATEKALLHSATSRSILIGCLKIP